MHLPSLLLTLLSLTTAVDHCPPTTTPNPSREVLREAMNDFTTVLYLQKNFSAACNKYVAADYIQHNADILGGRAAVIAALELRLAESEISFEVAETMIGEGLAGQSFAIVHLRVTTVGGADYTVVDMYRLEGTCLVEHWDVLQPMNPWPSNPNAYF